MIRFTRDENAAAIQIRLISVDPRGIAPHPTIELATAAANLLRDNDLIDASSRH
jgi:hypothetical protein